MNKKYVVLLKLVSLTPSKVDHAAKVSPTPSTYSPATSLGGPTEPLACTGRLAFTVAIHFRSTSNHRTAFIPAGRRLAGGLSRLANLSRLLSPPAPPSAPAPTSASIRPALPLLRNLLPILGTSMRSVADAGACRRRRQGRHWQRPRNASKRKGSASYWALDGWIRGKHTA